jgi:hypothetical protein
MVLDIENSETDIITEMLASDMMYKELLRFLSLRGIHHNELTHLIAKARISLLLFYMIKDKPVYLYLEIVRSTKYPNGFDIISSRQIQLQKVNLLEEKGIIILGVDTNKVEQTTPIYKNLILTSYREKEKFFNVQINKNFRHFALDDQDEPLLSSSKVETEIQKLRDNQIKLLFTSIDHLSSRIAKLEEEQREYNDAVSKLQEENTLLKEIQYQSATTYDADEKIQLIPIDIYLSESVPEINYAVYQSVLDYVNACGFEKIFEFKDQKGSWYKRAVAWTKSKMTQEDVKTILQKGEYGIEANAILKTQSEIEKNQSEALLNIITALKDTPNAAIRIGSLIVVKVTTGTGEVNLQSRTLTVKELHIINKRPDLLSSPQQILGALAKEVTDSDQPPSIN